MKLFRKIFVVLLLFIIVFECYAFYITRNAVNMNTRQKILKAAYPALMWFQKLAGKNKSVQNNGNVQPLVSFYSLNATAIDGSHFNFSSLQGKKVLIVNTASECGYTGQFDELEALYQQYKPGLEIIAFPANDFKDQEKGNDTAIAAFCKKNYGVSFPVMSKSSVIISPAQNAVFKWLTSPSFNGWNRQQPEWNFSKYLIDEKGQLVNYFATAVSPLSKEVKEAVERR